jgi:hypothetical protein
VSDLRGLASLRSLRSSAAPHTGVFISRGRSCKHVWEEFQTATHLPCVCEGFAPVTGALRDAAFTDRDVGDDLPPLRVVKPA